MYKIVEETNCYKLFSVAFHVVLNSASQDFLGEGYARRVLLMYMHPQTDYTTTQPLDELRQPLKTFFVTLAFYNRAHEHLDGTDIHAHCATNAFSIRLVQAKSGANFLFRCRARNINFVPKDKERNILQIIPCKEILQINTFSGSFQRTSSSALLSSKRSRSVVSKRNTTPSTSA